MAEVDSINGFILTRQWREHANGQQLIYWIATDEGAIKLVVSGEASVFFVKATDIRRLENLMEGLGDWHQAEVNLSSFDFKPVIACYFPSQKQLNQARSRLEGRISLFEADIRPTDRYLMERFVTASIHIEGVPKLDRQVPVYAQARIKPSQYMPKLSLVSLDIETSYTENILYSIAVYGCSEPTMSRRVFMLGSFEPALEYLTCHEDESATIRAFLAWFAEFDADVVIGWNLVDFDLRFLQDRCQVLKIPFSLGRQDETVIWRQRLGDKDKSYALVPGRVVLDGIQLLRTAFYRFESFSLDNVARELLGRGKLVRDAPQRGKEIQRMFAEDKTSLAEYNLDDCVLVWDIFNKTNLLQFAIERSALTGLDMDRMGGSVAAFDYLYLPRLHRRGFVAPVVEDRSRIASPGGYVLDSEPGLFEDVIVLDFKSLYPSIIRTFNVDPLAMVAGAFDAAPIPGFKGAVFSRQEGILPKIIETLWAARDKAKQRHETALSQAIKIIMNSFYGVLGTPGCRFFDPRLVSSITIRGHEILQTTRDLIHALGYRVIYGDTDSVFVHLKDIKTRQQADKSGREIMGYLNDWWRDHLAHKYQLHSYLEVEYETHYRRFMMPTVRGSDVGSKKRYAGIIETSTGSQLVFKGLEAVRSDWSHLAKEFQQELYRRIFADEPFEMFVKHTVEAVQMGLRDEKLSLRKRLRQRLDAYQKNVPPHVRAARLAEDQHRARGLPEIYQNGGWIEYIMTINGAEPVSYRTSKIDYQFYIDKQLAPIADAILHFKQCSFAQITDQQMRLF